MNCINHPDVPVSAYCQFCGKPLCKDCVRSVSGVVYCEQDLAARISGNPVGAAAAAQSASATSSAAYAASVPPVGAGPSPGLAALLGLIPGVGAMYNGQYAKALVHVLVFAVLVSLSHHNPFFGIMVMAWFFYQVFDAYQTAKARRDGLPLPNPLGMNDVAQWFTSSTGAPPSAAANVSGFVPPAGTAYVDPVTGAAVPPSGGYAAAYVDPATGAAVPSAGVPYATVVPPGAGVYDPVAVGRKKGPIGAVILIVLGVLFLLSSLDILQGDWFGKVWPLGLIALGIYIFAKRTGKLGSNPPQGGVQ